MTGATTIAQPVIVEITWDQSFGSLPDVYTVTVTGVAILTIKASVGVANESTSAVKNITPCC
jgi:hypothetical protein